MTQSKSLAQVQRRTLCNTASASSPFTITMLAIVRRSKLLRIKHFLAFAEELWQNPFNTDSYSTSFSYSEHFGTCDDNAKKVQKGGELVIRAFGRLTLSFCERNLQSKTRALFLKLFQHFFSSSSAHLGI